MKTLRILYALNFLLMIICITVVSCSKKKDAVNSAIEHNAAKFNDENKIRDSRFYVNAAEILLKEMQLSKIAQNNSIKKDVIKLAETTEIEYNQSYYSLKALAAKKTITIPSDISNRQENIYKKLSYEIADDFDKKYFEISEKDHRDAIELFEKIEKGSTDEDIKIWARSSLQTIKKNLDSVLIVDNKELKTRKYQ